MNPQPKFSQVISFNGKLSFLMKRKEVIFTQEQASSPNQNMYEVVSPNIQLTEMTWEGPQYSHKLFS